MQDAPSFHRNREPMLAVLGTLLPDSPVDVLEIASGSGQHGPFFTSQLTNVTWWPSDINDEAIQSIKSWRKRQHADRVKLPEVLDVTDDDWRNGVRNKNWPATFDAIFSMNMIHIAPKQAGYGLLEGAARHLKIGGLLIFYGPFKQSGKHTAPSNKAFDESLKSRDATWGIRDLEEIVERASAVGLKHTQTMEMPANNLVVVFSFQGQGV
jgi:SAM-dependent methyltransferase